ncbi:hypothetical protein F5Y14DRAFT_406360 [Nemania sp. NC0429]|nr:hypothetical protein F5Y14DRAFT_406360 [Nemania sp. NC0429]
MGDIPRCNITITNQSDIDSGSLSSCQAYATQFINIVNATEELNFTNLTKTDYITVTQSPQLKILNFPRLELLMGLSVVEANTLSSIYLRQLRSDAPRILPDQYSLGNVTSIKITDCPSLTEIDIPNAAGLHVLSLHNTPQLTFGNPNLTSIVGIQSSTLLYLPSVGTVQNLNLMGTGTGNSVLLPNLTSAVNFMLDKVGPGEITFDQQTITVIDTLSIDSSIVDDFYPSKNTLDLSPIGSVGNNAVITSNANVNIDLSNLDSVKGDLSINNNRNCTFDFGRLGEVINLLLLDNPNTRLRSFPSLARANTIHVRGYIDTLNLFPALTSVSDKVTIEAWNADFNCSKLVSQYHESIIPSLSCNGTDNGTDTQGPSSSPTPTPSGSGLAVGPKAGIGVGVAVGVLTAIIVIVWLVRRSKIRLRVSIDRGSQLLPPENGDIANTQHSEAQGLTWKREDGPIQEIGGEADIQQIDGRMIVQENPGSEIYELPSLSRERPINGRRSLE